MMRKIITQELGLSNKTNTIMNPNSKILSKCQVLLNLKKLFIESILNCHNNNNNKSFNYNDVQFRTRDGMIIRGGYRQLLESVSPEFKFLIQKHFNEKFKQMMNEKRKKYFTTATISTTIPLYDIDSGSVLLELFRFIYTGEIVELDRHQLPLMYAAEKV